MFLSVIIPAYNEEDYIGDTIRFLRNAIENTQPKDLEWEVIVCDNNSTDHTAEAAKKAGATVIPEPENQISKARNTGASIAQGDYLMFLDADSYPDSNLMSEIWPIIQSGKVSGVGATIKVSGGNLVNRLRMERLNPFFRWLQVCGGAFILCEKNAFQQINGFSENLYAYEDLDFVIRLKSYGRKSRRSFKVLYKNPVITSGRKVNNTIVSWLRMIISNFVAVWIFILHFILPGKIIRKLGKNWASYWYKQRD